MLLCLTASLLAADPPKSAAAWTPKDKEMVVLLGSAFIEQEARDGYLETELIRLFPNKDIRVRNLGWSGDTVHCQARSYFGPPEEGFERLRGHLQVIKPTTVICCYGANESWKGEPGIPDFRKAYERLIDMIRQTGATVVLMTPPRFDPREANSAPLEKAAEYLRRYFQEIKYIAEGRRCLFHDFGGQFPSPSTTVMANGVAYSTWGYSQAPAYFWGFMDESLRSLDPYVQASFKRDLKKYHGTKISGISKSDTTLRWTQLDDVLPTAASPPGVCFQREDHIVRCNVDGKPVRLLPPTQTVGLIEGPEVKQTDQLRQAIIKKNALFFHRWRPANETYLYGFRKHEQGNNGVEPPQFDKLVEQAEAEIARLKKPVPHKYELIRVEEKK